MTDDITAVLLCIVCVLGPLWIIFNYKSKSIVSQRLTAADQQAVDRMTQQAQALERRVASLERILDTELPSWRASTGSSGYGG